LTENNSLQMKDIGYLKGKEDEKGYRMKYIKDFKGLSIRLTDERVAHILEHPEMINMTEYIEETLQNPQYLIESPIDNEVNLYYRYYYRTLVGSKYLCVAVKVMEDDAFVITAFLTDTIKNGVMLWKER
jgi:hypothetical protein